MIIRHPTPSPILQLTANKVQPRWHQRRSAEDEEEAVKGEGEEAAAEEEEVMEGEIIRLQNHHQPHGNRLHLVSSPPILLPCLRSAVPQSTRYIFPSVLATRSYLL
jgi:hypothetical protein